MALEVEIEYYNELLPELLKQDEGKLAVIKGRELVGVFPDADAAYEVTLPKFGFAQLLMRPIRATQPVIDLTNLHFGLIRVRKS